jgi:hypothetical protein
MSFHRMGEDRAPAKEMELKLRQELRPFPVFLL